MALGSFLRENRALGLQQGVVGIAREISGRQASRRAQRTGFRSRREISRRGERTLRPLFPRGHFAIPVSSRSLPPNRIQRPPASLLDLQQQGSRRAPEQNARNGPEPSLARSPRSNDRRKTNGRHRDPRLFRPAEKMARWAEIGRASRRERAQISVV